MADKKFEIRFDRHGHILVEDAELEARLKWLLAHNGRLVIKLRQERGAIAEPMPRLLTCPQPLYACPQPANALCPNYICPEGILHVVQQGIYEDAFGAIGGGEGVRE